MENANLPIPNAREPDEGARQPQVQCESYEPAIQVPSKTMESPKRKKSASQIKSTAVDEPPLSQPPLSQPPPGISQRQRLQWLQQRRATGLWVSCDACGQWRYLPHALDRHELPRLWYCNMNPDADAARCSVPEAPLRVRDEEDMIHSEYSAGSLVLARLAGFPWWPAMVDDCPEAEQFYWLDGYSDIPTHYNVVFLDSKDSGVSRNWVSPQNLKPYGPNKNKIEFKRLLKTSLYKDRLQAAVSQANDAESLSLSERLSKYSFVSRYQGVINKPGKVKKTLVNKWQNKMKRKFNIVFDTDSAEGNRREERGAVRENVILLGTTKRSMQIDKKGINAKETNEQVLESNELDNNNVVQRATKQSKKMKKQTIAKEINKQMADTNNIDRIDVVSNIAKEAETKTQNDSANEFSKQPNSLAVQVGSILISSLNNEKTFDTDNDTSKTFVPESESEPESVYAIDKEIQKFMQRSSRNSADFDFV